MDELQEMKATMSLLNEQLNKEKIVSDQLLRDVTRRQLDKLGNVARKDCIEALFLLLCGTYFFYRMGCSWGLIIATALMAILLLLSALIPLPRIRREIVSSGDLLMVARQLRAKRKAYARWICARIWVEAGWFIWVIIEMLRWYHITSPWVYAICALMWIGVGAIAVNADKYRYRGYLREMDQVIAQIEQ